MSQLGDIQHAMQAAQVTRALCICTTLENFDDVHGLAMTHPNMWATVGVHPDNEGVREPSLQDLLEGAARPKVVAIGETGLDYYQMEERKGGRTVADMEWQRERFRVHIRASRATGKPLIIHTRSASADTLRILQEEKGGTDQGGVAGVMHCFTESMEVAQASMAMGFYISFSGIVTFKSAKDLQAVALAVPLER
eukprot:gene48978-65665_t